MIFGFWTLALNQIFISFESLNLDVYIFGRFWTLEGFDVYIKSKNNNFKHLKERLNQMILQSGFVYFFKDS